MTTISLRVDAHAARPRFDFRRLSCSVLTALLGSALLTISTASEAAAVLKPSQDPFYVQPAVLPNLPAGTIIGSREVSFYFDGSLTPFPLLPLPTKVKSWQIQYLSTDTFNKPVMDIATVLVSERSTTDSPLLAYQTATDSDSLEFAPSYELRKGAEIEGALFVLGLGKGWKVVVPDFEGLHAEYTAGRQAGHATLDAIRAAEHFAPAGMHGATTPVVMWGYSGGAQATAWATELQPSYAPELNILGTAEGGVPVDIIDVANVINKGPFVGIFFAAALGVTRAYNVDIMPMLNAKGLKMIATIGDSSITRALLSYPFQNINSYMAPAYQNPLNMAVFQNISNDDRLGQGIPRGPLFVYGGTISDVLPEADVHALAKQYCSEGVTVQTKFIAGDHFTTAVTGAPAALSYLTDRLAGKPAPSNCATAN